MPERPETCRAVGIALVAMTAAGCAEELGPEAFATARVAGTVRVAGGAVTSGWIEFLPSVGTRGDIRSAPIRRDGSFATDGVPVGEVAVRLVGVYGPPIPTPFGAVKLDAFRSFQTPIRASVPAGGLPHLDVDLAVEAVRSRREAVERSRRFDEPGG